MQLMGVIVVLLVFKVSKYHTIILFSNSILFFLGSGNGSYILYVFDQANSVQANMTLTFNTNLGTYNKSTIT